MDFDTTVLHADDELAESPDVAPALRPTTTFERTAAGRVYRREGDETTDRLEAVLGALEGGHSVFYPSGMAAVAALLRFLRPRRIALPDDLYHGVRAFVAGEAERGSWQLAKVDELTEGDVWWVETPSNPKCLITDLGAVAAAAGERRIITVVDGTFATPILQRPLAFGIDYSMHATTKIISGHSDAMGGVVSTGDAVAAGLLRQNRTRDGSVPGALETWLTLRSVRTLPLRVRRQSESALEVARFLHSRSVRVWYPGLPGGEDHEVARRQMDGFGPVLSFDIGDADAARALVGDLRVFTDATSLGGVESLAEHRLLSDPTSPPGLIRLSIGLESPDALRADLGAALDRVGV